MITNPQARSCRLAGFDAGNLLMQGMTSFTGTMLEVKKTHVLVVLDLQRNADLQKFMKGAAGHGRVQTITHIHMIDALRHYTAMHREEVIVMQHDNNNNNNDDDDDDNTNNNVFQLGYVRDKSCQQCNSSCSDMSACGLATLTLI